MILDQLVEKKDLYIYINLRINHLERLLAFINSILTNEDWHLSNKKYKKMEKSKRKWLAQIHELERLKTLLHHATLKKQCKTYWGQQNQKV